MPARSTKQLFELALQIEPPWRVATSDFDLERRRVDLRPGLPGRFAIPVPDCGRASQAVDLTEGTWRQPDMPAAKRFSR